MSKPSKPQKAASVNSSNSAPVNGPVPAPAGNSFRFTLVGLIIFSLALIVGTSVLNFKILAKDHGSKPADPFLVDPKDKSRTIHSGAWGDLLMRDIELERPAEYLTEEVAIPHAEVWNFNGMNADAVKALLGKNGLTAAQVDLAFAPGTFTVRTTGTELRPSDAFLLSFGSDVRAKLYPALAGMGIYLYLDYPYIFPADTVDSIYRDPRLEADDVAVLKQFIYPNGNARQLVDYDALLIRIPTAVRRVAVAKALSRQSALLGGLMVKPDTDIDKIANYWGNIPGVHFTDIRPLLEALKQLPDGGNLGLYYLLPKFARDRLYTFPLPPQAGEPIMDCHWSTFNFCNDTPDNRFNDPAFAVAYIQKNYYQIAAPSVYGDILLLMNDKQEIKHSATYLADDIVFTKNGNNYRQPWMLMRIPDLLATYPSMPPMHAVYMRRKVD